MENITLYVLILIVVIVPKVKGNILSFIQSFLLYYDLVLLIHDSRTYVEEEEEVPHQLEPLLI